MRIALFTDTYSPQVNGVARTLARLVKHLQQRGHVVALVTPRSGPEAADPAAALHIGIPGWRLPFYPELTLPRLLDGASAERLRAFAPDLVHVATEFTLGWSGLQWAQQHDVPAVSSFHTDFPAYLSAYGVAGLESLAWRYLRAFHGRVRLTLCPSQATLQQLRAAGFKGVLRIWSRGVDAQLFQPQRASLETRRALAGAADPIILCVSRLAPEKRLDLLLSAFAQLQPEFPNAALVIVGDGPAHKALREQAGPSVIFTGYLTGVPLAAAYASADLFAFPSDTETFGNVMLEAAASGLPLVGADTGGVTETVIHGLTGLRFNAGDAESLAACLRTILRTPDLKRALSESARTFAQARSWDHILDDVIIAYHAAADCQRSLVA